MKRTKARLITAGLLVVCLVAVTMLAGACGKKDEAPPAASTPADSAAAESTPADSASEAPAPEKIDLKLSLHDPVESSNGKFLQSLADEVSQKTNGGLTITLFGGGTLAAAPDVGEMVENGGVDIGWMYTSYYPGQFPLTDVTTVPMIGFGDPVVSTNTLWDLYDKYPELQNEWSRYKLLDLYGNPGMLFASSKKPIKVPADVKGLTMRSPAGPVTDFVTSLKGNPVVMAPPDLYEAIEKNNIDAYIFEPAGITNFKLEAVTKYFTDMPIYDGAFGLVMNLDKWNSLPDEYKAALEEATGRAGSLKAAENFKTSAEAAHGTIADAGGEWIAVDDVAAWEKAAEPIITAWPGTVKLDGFDAKAYIDDAIAIAKGYQQ